MDEPLGLAMEGIFRIPGKHEDIQEICLAFNTGML